MAKKKHYLILDTETTTDAKLVYDIAYTIIDRKGNVVKQVNYLVKEMIEHPFMVGALARDKFSAKKYKNLYCDWYSNKKMVCPFLDIRRIIRKDIRDYNCIVTAYNAAFDFSALNAMATDLGVKRFFTKKTEVWDLWNIALHILCNSKNYTNFCDAHNFVSDKGNRKSSAEVVYRYIIQDVTFEEAHTALADTEIEAAILLACLKRHKKLHTNFVGQVFRHPIWIARCKV